MRQDAGVAGTVYTPVAEIEPQPASSTDQATVVLAAPATMAAKLTSPEGATQALGGLTSTPTAAPIGLASPAPPPQAACAMREKRTRGDTEVRRELMGGQPFCCGTGVRWGFARGGRAALP
jgi:hypothetical protein